LTGRKGAWGDRVCGVVKRVKKFKWSLGTGTLVLKNRLSILLGAPKEGEGGNRVGAHAGCIFSFWGVCMNHDGVQSRLRLRVSSVIVPRRANMMR
jgi:hypothetical protein